LTTACLLADDSFDILVNDDAHQAEQLNPRVAVNFAGEFVVVWADKRTGRSEIFFQYFDSAGVPLGLNQKIAGLLVDAPQYGPAMDANQLGQFGTVWTDYRNGSHPFDPDIYYSAIDINGPGTNSSITDARPDSSCESPDIAVLPGGDIIIVWADRRDRSWNIFGQLINSNGSPVGANFQINSEDGLFQQHSPRVAAISDGRFIVVWYDNRFGDDDIYGRVFNADGSPVAPDFRVNDDSDQTKQAFPTVATDGNGRYFIAWVDWQNGTYPKNPDIYYRRYDETGTPLGECHKLVSDANKRSQKDVAICSDRMGNLGIVWADSTSGQWDAMAQIVDNLGAAAGSSFLIHQNTEGKQLQPDIATDGYKFFFVWADSRNGDFDIYVTIKNYNDPTLVSQPTILTFNMQAGQAAPVSQTISLTNTGYGELDFIVSSGDDWITVVPDSGKTPAVVEVQINGDNLMYGDYIGKIRLIDLDHNDSSEVVSVVLKVTAPLIGITPDTLGFKVLAELGNPDNLSFQVNNVGSGTFNWTAVENSDWFDLGQYSGVSSDNIEVSVDISGLEYGTYLEPIAVASNEAVNSPDTVWVRLELTGNMSFLRANPETLIIRGGEDDILAGQIEISNPGSGALDWTAVISADWLSLDKNSGTDYDTIFITIDDSLPTGSYGTEMLIFDSASFNQIVNVPVYLYISSDDTVLIANANTMPGQLAVVPLYLNLSAPAKALYVPISYDNTTAVLDSIIPNTAELPSSVNFFSGINGGTAEFGLRVDESVFDTESIPAGNIEMVSLFFTAGNDDVFNRIDTLSSDSSGLYILSEALQKKVPALIPGELIIGNPTDIEIVMAENIPENIYLSQNYPNPFNSSTSIDLILNRRSQVSMKIYNILGQTVFDYGDIELPIGNHRFNWDGTMKNSSRKAPSGIYFYRLITAEYSTVKKMVLLK